MAVQVLASPVVTHRGARVGMAGGDLDIAQVNTSVERDRNGNVPEHVRVCPGDLDARCPGEVAQAVSP